MKLRKKYSRSVVMMAMMHGVIMGIAGVLIFGFLLNVSNRFEVKNDDPETELTVSGPVDGDEGDKGDEKDPSGAADSGTGGAAPESPDKDAVSFFALQHGVFSSQASAKEFTSADPALLEAAIVPAAGQYFVWSSIDVTDKELKNETKAGDVFVKPFTLNGASCPAGEAKVPQLLKETDIQKFNFDDSVKSEDLPAKWRENVAAVTAFTKDIKSVRTQLLAHYSLKNDCLKIEF